jgi:hypothetical protein
MDKNRKMRPESIPGIRTKENDGGGEFSYNTL